MTWRPFLVVLGLVPGAITWSSGGLTGLPPATVATSAPTVLELKEIIQTLVAVHPRGREVGSPGETAASVFLATQLGAAGFAPLFGAGRYTSGFAVTVDGIPTTGYNVAGILRATVPAAQATPESVVLGAHFDHLAPDANGTLRPGADDNASGVAAVLAAARRLANVSVRQRDMAVFFWSGEEQGCVGSRAMIDHVVDHMAPIAYINLDMVGRNPDVITIEGVESGSLFAALLNAANKEQNLTMSIKPWFNDPTDSYTFANRNVPTLNLTTGKHSDYHLPTDTEDKVTYSGLSRISELTTAVATGLLTGPLPTFHKPAGAAGVCQ